MIKYFNILKNIPILSDIPDQQLKDFLLQSKLLELKKKTILYLEGSTDDNVYFLLKGAVRGYVTHEDRQIVDLFWTDNNFIANIDSIFMDLPSRLTVECITPCIIFSISRKLLFSQLAIAPNLQYKIYNILVSYLRIHEERVMLLTKYPIATKSYLRFREIYGSYADIFPNKDVASYLGITAEALTRIKKNIVLSKE